MVTEFLDQQVNRVAGEVAATLAAQKTVPFDAARAAEQRAAYDDTIDVLNQNKDALQQAARQLAASRADLDLARTQGGAADLPALEAAVAEALEAVAAAGSAVRQAEIAVQNRHRDLAETYGTAGAPARLGRGVPLLLLPVRVETRYFTLDAAHYELRLRLFPDAAHIDDHQALMSALEYEAGRRYWQTRLTEGAEGEGTLGAWHILCERLGESRAAWVAATLDPFGADGRQQASSGEPPPLPAPPLAPEGWAEPAHARALPDRWAVVGFHQDKRVLLHWTGPVTPDLQVSPDPGLPGEAFSGETDTAEFAAGMQWLTDFAAAEACGMAARIPVEKTIARHMDRLFVFGVRVTRTPTEGGADLAALVEAQVAGSLGFVSAGTPTNNTEMNRSGYRERPREHAEAHGILLSRRPGSSGGTREDERLARALDVDPTLLRRIPGGNPDGETTVEAIHRLLWYATWDDLLRQQVEADLSEAAITFGRRHFRDYVRPRGPLPLLRIQHQPYGVLPVLSLERWRPSGADIHLKMLVNILRSMRDDLVAFSRYRHLRLPPSDDPQRDLLNILSGSPIGIATEASIKSFATVAKAIEVRAKIKPWWDAVIPLLRNGKVSTLVPHGGQRLYIRTFGRTNSDYDHTRPLVKDQGEKDDPLPAGINYLAHLASRPAVADVRNHQIAGAQMRSVLYLLLREAYEAVPTFDLDATARFFDALLLLKDLPVHYLEALTNDVVDACTHRFDAWVTSIASRRLNEVRVGRRTDGIHLGGYGWVEGLVPPGEGARDGSVVAEDPDSGGYLHLPSQAQARTAAVLHGAYQAHMDRSFFNVSFRLRLPSDRVRAARWLLSGMRQGQALGALLGYRIEREMVGAGLGAHIPVLRAIAPSAVGPSDPADSAQDRSLEDPATAGVADGLVLVYLFNQAVLDDRLRAHDLARNAELATLRVVKDAAEMLQGLGDLLLAEGVHQAVGGNPDRAAAAFDAMAEGGGRVPEPEVTSTPAAGQQIGQRLVVALPAPGEAWPGDDRRPRVMAEPRLNTWAATLLGSPDAIAFTAIFTPENGAAVIQRPFTLAEVDISPLDLVYLTGPRAETAPLIALLAYQLRERGPQGTGFAGSVSIDPAVGTDAAGSNGGRTLEEALALAHQLHRVLTESRPLSAADLTPGESADDVDEAELAVRADAVQAALQELQAALDTDPVLPDNWWRAAVLLGPADPQAPTTLSALRAGIARRLRDHAEADDAGTRLAALLGGSFTLLPVFVAGNAAVLEAGFADQEALLEGDAASPRRWLQDHARVKPGAEALDDLLTIAELMGTPTRGSDRASHGLAVAQLPFRPGEIWVGERIPESGVVPRLSLVVHMPLPVDYRRPIAGLLVDGWSDVLPRRTATTGLAFNYDAPKAQAPQSLLIALPPDLNRDWSFEDLEATVLETFEIMRLRLTNPSERTYFGDYLPALYLRGDMQGDLNP